MDHRARRTWHGVGLTVSVLVAVGLVAAGILSIVARPLASPIGPAPEATRWFGQELLDRIARYRQPLYVLLPLAALVGAVGPLLIVSSGPVRRRLHRSELRSPARSTGSVVPPSGSVVPPSGSVVLWAGVIAVGVVLLQDVLLLPFRWWVGYVHAGAFGLRTQGPWGWAFDQLIASATGWVGAGIVGMLLAWLVCRLPRAWPLAAGLALAMLSGLVLIVWPLIVEPLRFDFTPLSEGRTRAAVEEVGAAAGLGDAPILVADASRRTTRRNAYVSGLGATRRIVLYDTLLDLPDQQIAAVVAHEVAHDLHQDLLRGWLTGAAVAIIGCVAAGVAVWQWQRRAGSSPSRLVASKHRVAVLVALALLVEALTVPAVALLSRRAEAAADATALELIGEGEAFVGLQRSLVEANLSDPTPPDWWVWWRSTHPAPAARLYRADSFPSRSAAAGSSLRTNR